MNSSFDADHSSSLATARWDDDGDEEEEEEEEDDSPTNGDDALLKGGGSCIGRGSGVAKPRL